MNWLVWLVPNWAFWVPRIGSRSTQITLTHKHNLTWRLTLRGFGVKNFKITKVFTHKAVWAQIGHSGYPEMGQGVPKSLRPMNPLLLGAQNYGDLGWKISKFPKFSLIKLFGKNWAFWVPRNGSRGTQITSTHKPNLAWRPKLWGSRVKNIKISEIFTNKAVGPKLGILGTPKWVKEGPDRFLSFILSCCAPKIMGIQGVKM